MVEISPHDLSVSLTIAIFVAVEGFDIRNNAWYVSQLQIKKAATVCVVA